MTQQILPIVGTAALIFRQGKVLLSKRINAKHQGGIYGCPGGKVDFGETPRQCIRRECMEELGPGVKIKFIRDIPLISSVVYVKESVHVFCFWYEVILDEPKGWDGNIDYIEVNPKTGEPKNEKWTWFDVDFTGKIEVPVMTDVSYAIQKRNVDLFGVRDMSDFENRNRTGESQSPAELVHSIVE